jgi:large subunit ribosomal protein L30
MTQQLIVIRISGDVKIREEFRETLRRLGLKKKYSATVLENPTAIELGMIKHVENFIAFGEISDEMKKKLIAARGKKFSSEQVQASSAKNVERKKRKYKNEVFRLHPPRKGIDSKLHFGIKKGVLGNHGKEIDKLVERML